jgi:hypothetical protein
MLTGQMMVDSWMSHTLTHGILFGKCNGAKCQPSIGCYGNSFMDSTRVEPVTSGPGGVFWKGWATSPPTLVLKKYRLNVLFKLATLYFG